MRRLGVLVVHWVGFAAPPAEHVDDRAGGRNRHRDVSRDLLAGGGGTCSSELPGINFLIDFLPRRGQTTVVGMSSKRVQL